MVDQQELGLYQNKKAPAVLRDIRKATSAEAIAAEECELAEGRQIAGDDKEILINHRHSLKMKLFNRGVGGAEGLGPRGEPPAPTLRQKAKISKSRLPLERHRPDSREPGDGASWVNSIAVSDEELPAGPRLGVVPGPTDKRSGVAIMAGGEELEHVLKDVLKDLVRERGREIGGKSNTSLIADG